MTRLHVILQNPEQQAQPKNISAYVKTAKYVITM